VQRAIVARWQQAQNEIAAAEERIKQMEAHIAEQFFEDLGLKPPTEVDRPKAFAVQWNNFSRWSVSYNQAAQSGADITRGKYPIVELGSILELVQYGTSEKANTTGSGTPVIRMNNIIDGMLDLTDLKHIQLSQREQDQLLLIDGDILFNRTNSKEWVGKCAAFHANDNYVFASYLIRIRTDAAKANPDFVAYSINSPLGRQQINAMSRQIIGQANINSEELRSLQIPLPPLDVQRDIMRRVAKGRAEIAREREAAQRRARDIEAEIEALILGTKAIA
jgi:restriction endonuclease S subunit